MESRKLLLENTFAVKEVFSNNEATSWAVEELKRRRLKRLFKPVASTAYERLVREFYTHLRIDDDQPDSLFSSIDGRNVEVTVEDITCNAPSPLRLGLSLFFFSNKIFAKIHKVYQST
jgi:hypothetical protein